MLVLCLCLREIIKKDAENKKQENKEITESKIYSPVGITDN